MFEVTLNVEGLDQLGKNLEALPAALAVKVLQDAMLAGGEVIAEKMEENAPRAHDIGPRQKGQQHIADDIQVQQEKKPIGSAAEVYVGPGKATAYRARWQEFGTASHAIRAKRAKMLADLAANEVFGSAVSHPGEPPRPFMRTALESAGGAAIEKIKETLAAGLADAAAKVNKT